MASAQRAGADGAVRPATLSGTKSKPAFGGSSISLNSSLGSAGGLGLCGRLTVPGRASLGASAGVAGLALDDVDGAEGATSGWGALDARAEAGR
jgi:hypothetical protein